MLHIENIQDFVLGAICAGAPVIKCKKLASVYARRGIVGEKIVTDIDKTENTVGLDLSTGKPDWVITNPGGEKYIVCDSVFTKSYEQVGTESGVYRKKAMQLLVPCSQTVEFVPAWGGTFTVENGGYFTLNGPNDIAGIQKGAFDETYEIVADNTIGLREEAMQLLIGIKDLKKIEIW